MIKIPATAPLTDAQQKQLADLLSSLSPDQVAWVAGHLSSTEAERNIAIIYGTESGNSEELAEQVFKTAKQKGFKPTLANMSEITPAALKDADVVLVVVSTWGDGEPPETAEAFYNALMESDISLKGVQFSVCALGDTSYDQFCQTGKEIDTQLEKLGAERIVERVDCDVDFEDSFATWADAVWQKLGSASVSTSSAAPSATSGEPFGRKNPFPSEVLENLLLSGDYSKKETIHVELSLDGSGLEYEPGDVLALLPKNAADVVASIIQCTGLSSDTQVEIKGVGENSLSEALTNHLDITGLSRKVAKNWLTLSKDKSLESLLSPDSKAEWSAWTQGRQIIDLLETYPAENITAQQFVDVLRKLPPRLYSISSSPKAHPGEVHLTVGVVRYETEGKKRKGVASTYLADDSPKGSHVSVYVHPNKKFRLPEDPQTPIIMVGPGTGVAPFRAFVEERAAEQAPGESWLFFGDQHYNEDFLYQLEWQEALKNGSLTRLDVAFSRDQPEKVYVQHKLLEHASEVWEWLEKGACFYICGNASRMAKSVHETLLKIVQTQGEKSAEEAEEYVANLKNQNRYQRDVY